MDDVTLRQNSRDEPDLASIVLGTERTGERHLGAPERVPAWVDHTPARGYDARSVAVLGLVVAVLAALIGWATTIGDATPAPPTASTTQAATEMPAVPGDTVQASTAPTEPADAVATAALVPGIDLTPGRLTARRSGSGSALVALSVRNAGATDLTDGSAAVLLLVDDDVVGTEQLGALASGVSTRVEVSMGSCPAGTLPIVAVIDPGSVVRESNERNNSISTRTTFGC